ncbi:hypothetical protein [Streptomyces sp. NPDC127038]|uniref:hypothetical protein n=1 Tax=Streptomyces sp. NPDC127038 TaxID=3347114 RepID=UPI0036503E2E
MTSLRWGLALSGWLTLAVVTLLADASVLRATVTTAFVLVCPGLAASRWARSDAGRLTDRTAALETGVLTLALSLSIGVLVVEPLFLSGTFSVTRALLALAAVTSALALSPRPGRGRRREAPGAPGPDPRPAGTGRTEPPPTDRSPHSEPTADRDPLSEPPTAGQGPRSEPPATD